MVALTLIPLQLLVAWLFQISPFGENHSMMSGLLFVIAFVTLLLLIKLYRNELVESWSDFRKKLWLKFLLSTIGAIMIVIILQVIRMIMALFITINAGENDVSDPLR